MYTKITGFIESNCRVMSVHFRSRYFREGATVIECRQLSRLKFFLIRCLIARKEIVLFNLKYRDKVERDIKVPLPIELTLRWYVLMESKYKKN